MKTFPHGHATHPDWRMACALVLAQLRAQLADGRHAAAPALGLLYITDHFADAAEAVLAHLRAELPKVRHWCGSVGVGVAATNVEYKDEPALALMLLDLPPTAYRVFSGLAPLPTAAHFAAHTALVHADAHTPDVADLIADLAGLTATGYLFGGLASSRGRAVQFAVTEPPSRNAVPDQAVGGVFSGGLSGVAFGPQVDLISRVTQGCQPVAPEREVTAADANVLLMLDDEPALDVMLRDLGVTLDVPRRALDAVRRTLVGLSGGGSEGLRHTGHFGADVRVRHIIGVDPARRGVAIAERPQVGQRAAFCQRNVQAARADLMRICAEIREELEPEEALVLPATALDPRAAQWLTPALGPASAAAPASSPRPARHIAGAIYVSCAGRGGPHFGGPSAELQIVRHALGDVPLVGFFAGGEIARHHLYGYTGVLTAFVTTSHSDAV